MEVVGIPTACCQAPSWVLTGCTGLCCRPRCSSASRVAAVVAGVFKGLLAPVPTAPAVCEGRGIARSQLLCRCRAVLASGSSNAVGGQNLRWRLASDTEPQGPSPQDLQEWAQGRDATNDVPIEAAPDTAWGSLLQTFFPQASRIIAIGDVHGDEGADCSADGELRGHRRKLVAARPMSCRRGHSRPRRRGARGHGSAV